jgi:hypothetical protein
MRGKADRGEAKDQDQKPDRNCHGTEHSATLPESENLVDDFVISRSPATRSRRRTKSIAAAQRLTLA